MDYPAQIDMAWLAVDSAGRVAAMVTAGRGPMPAQILDNDWDEMLGAEEALHGLPSIAKGFIHAGGGDVSSCMALSQRGLFVYDWSDVHRVRGYLDAYELVTSPSVALNAAYLPADLRRLAATLDPSVRLGQRTVRIDGPSRSPC
jgi:hypothetical protein